MLYTILPIEKIFEGTYKNDFYITEEKTYNGQQVEVIKTEDNTYKLSRIISTDPQVYLDEKFTPGKMLTENIMK